MRNNLQPLPPDACDSRGGEKAASSERPRRLWSLTIAAAFTDAVSAAAAPAAASASANQPTHSLGRTLAVAAVCSSAGTLGPLRGNTTGGAGTCHAAWLERGARVLGGAGDAESTRAGSCVWWRTAREITRREDLFSWTVLLPSEEGVRTFACSRSVALMVPRYFLGVVFCFSRRGLGPRITHHAAFAFGCPFTLYMKYDVCVRLKSSTGSP